MPPLLHRRVFLSVWQAFLVCLAVFLFFMFMWRGIQSDGILAGIALDLWSTAKLFAYMLPAMALQILPLSAALAIYLAFSRMNGDRELVALRAGGLSLPQLLPAPLLFGLLCALLGLGLSFFGQSWGLAAMRTQMLDLAESGVRLVLRPGIFNQDLPGLVFFSRQVDAGSGQIADVTIIDQNRAEQPMVIGAPFGQLGADRQRGEIYLLLRNGSLIMRNQGGLIRLDFEEYVMRFGLKSLLSGASLGPVSAAEMPWRELYGRSGLSLSGENTAQARQMLVERQKRLVYPLSCLVLVLALLPIVCTSRGPHQKSSLLNALLVIGAYYGLLLLIEDLGSRGSLDPQTGFWLVPAVFTALALLNLGLTNADRKPALLEATLAEYAAQMFRVIFR